MPLSRIHPHSFSSPHLLPRPFGSQLTDFCRKAFPTTLHQVRTPCQMPSHRAVLLPSSVPSPLSLYIQWCRPFGDRAIAALMQHCLPEPSTVPGIHRCSDLSLMKVRNPLPQNEKGHVQNTLEPFFRGSHTPWRLPNASRQRRSHRGRWMRFPERLQSGGRPWGHICLQARSVS